MTEPARPSITVGFVAKEKFHVAAEALEALLAGAAGIPFNLIIVDGRMPARYNVELERVLARWPRVPVRFIRRPHFLQPNQARNLVARASTDDYVALVENDSIVPPGWLAGMMDACLAYPDGCVVFAEMYEGPPEDPSPHVDPSVGFIVPRREGREVVREIVADSRLATRHLNPSRMEVGANEAHVFLLPRAVYHRIGGFDDALTTREHWDIALRLQHAGIPGVLEGRVRARFHPAPPLDADELAFFRFAWNARTARASNEHLLRAWKIVNLPGSVGFVRAQTFRAHALSWRAFQAIRRRVPAVARLFEDRPLDFRELDRR